MPKPLPIEAVVECVQTLANDIARASPECADKALRIADLVGDLRMQPDRGAIRDVIEATTLDAGLSDSTVHLTTSAVMAAIRSGSADEDL